MESSPTADNDHIYESIPCPIDTDSMRVLTLHPSESFNDHIICSLETIQIHNDMHHEALSYTWGPEHPNASITVNDQAITIRENLFQALLNLRNRNTPRRLWIDAICINQSNIEERNWQVQLMGDIYSKSTRTIIWLGVDSINEPRLEISNEDVDRLCHDEYWTRIWSIQEIVLSRGIHVQFGLTCISWGAFMECIEESWNDYGDYPRLFDRIRRDRRMTSDLGYLLMMFHASECEVPHDRVYGFLGLLPEWQRCEIPVDYGMDVQELFRVVKERVRDITGGIVMHLRLAD